MPFQIHEAKAKVTSSTAELSAERKKSAKQAVLLSRMQKDWSDLGNLQDMKQLRDTVSQMYKKYIKLQDTPGSGLVSGVGKLHQGEDDEETSAALAEIRQRAFLEKTVPTLKAQMQKMQDNHRRAMARKVKENSFLIQEIEELKKELKAVRGYRVPKILTSTQSTSTAD